MLERMCVLEGDDDDVANCQPEGVPPIRHSSVQGALHELYGDGAVHDSETKRDHAAVPSVLCGLRKEQA